MMNVYVSMRGHGKMHFKLIRKELLEHGTVHLLSNVRNKYAANIQAALLTEGIFIKVEELTRVTPQQQMDKLYDKHGEITETRVALKESKFNGWKLTIIKS